MATDSMNVRKQSYTTINITFLIGNGFDLGIGLDTTYKHFLDYYLKEKSSLEILEDFKNQINDELNSWSDAEKAFGEFPFSKLGEDVEEAYLECYADFKRNFCRFLNVQEKRFNEKSVNDKICKQFREILVSLWRGSSHWSNFSSIGNFGIVQNVNVINFNYTSVFDNLLKSDSPTVGMSRSSIRISGTYFNKCIHIHGSLQEENDILFGVNDHEQILDEKFKKLSINDGYLVKPVSAQQKGHLLYEKAKQILEETDILVLFGLSYGATDKIWWDLILENINFKDKNFYVILCPYEKTFREAHMERNHIRKQTLKHFLKHTSIGSDGYSKFMNNTKIEVLSYGPYTNQDTGESYYCDPLRLNYFGRHCVKDFARDLIVPSY